MIRNYCKSEVAIVETDKNGFLGVREFYPVDGYARMRSTEVGAEWCGAVPVRCVRREVTGLPEPRAGCFLLVSCEVAKAMEPQRHDLLVPTDPVLVPRDLRYACGVRQEAATLCDGMLTATIARRCLDEGLVCYGYRGFVSLVADSEIYRRQVQADAASDTVIDIAEHYRRLRQEFERQLPRTERMELQMSIQQSEILIWSKRLPRMCFGVDDVGLHRFLLCLQEYEESYYGASA